MHARGQGNAGHFDVDQAVCVFAQDAALYELVHGLARNIEFARQPGFSEPWMLYRLT